MRTAYGTLRGVARGPSAQQLLGPLDLLVDGPVRFGDRVPERGPGVYVVETTEPSREAPLDHGAIRAWLERVPTLRLDGERPEPSELARRLAAFWIPDTPVLFIGSAPRSIAGRIAAQHATALGSRRPYPGAYWLRTLRDAGRWRVWWARTEAVEEYADALMSAFAQAVSPEAVAGLPAGTPVLPFGNLGSLTGERRDHGLTGASTDEEAPPDRLAGLSAAARLAPSRRRAAAGSTGARTATRRPAGARSTRPAPAPTDLSAEGLARLQAELEDRRNVERPQVIARVAAARALGDLRENADYEAARNEQSFLEGRIRSLEALIASARIIRATGAPEARLGSRVIVEVDGGRHSFELVGSTEADPAAGRISDRSPVGKALMGGRAGDEVAVRLPSGEVRYRIIEVA